MTETKEWTTPKGKKARWEIWVSRNGKEPEQIGFYYRQHSAQNTVEVLNKLKGVNAHLRPVNTNEEEEI